MYLSELANIIHGQLQGRDLEWTGVNTDTRALQPGQLFFALKGEHFDGYDFLTNAERAGAVAAVVSSALTATNMSLIVVDDPLMALADLAKHHRRQFHCPFIAVTGSCGKTTSKMLLESVFSECGKVLANPSSFNNAIGVPLTLLQLTSDHEYAITELGANHPGEIALLSRLVEPQVAIITCAANVHLEGFGDIAGVVRTKGEIFQGLRETGIAILNADDAQIVHWRNMLPNCRLVTFAIEQTADITAHNITLDSHGQPSFELHTPQGECQIHLPLMGRHNVYNALVAAATAYVFNIDLAKVARGLGNARAVSKRLVEYAGMAGVTIIDDSYNANPESMLAAIQLLTQRSAHSILVMGDMLELGTATDEFHRKVGEQAKLHGVRQLFCLGKHSALAAEAFGTQGFSFSNHEQLINALKPRLQQNMVVLIKGSRGMVMEKVVAALRE